MSDFHVRNVRVYFSGGDNYDDAQAFMFVLRESLIAAQWQIIDDESDPAYNDPGNIFLSLSDAQFAAASATEIYSATGGFDVGMESGIISVYGDGTAAGNANRGLYNIKKVIDSNTILVDERNRVAPWSDQTGVTIRVFQVDNPYIANSRNLVFQPPAASGINVQYQLTINSTGSQFYLYAYPLGDYATTKLITASHVFTVPYNISSFRFNLCLSDGNDPHFRNLWYWYDGTGWVGGAFGKLSQCAAADPAFFIQRLVNQNQSYGWDVALEHDLKMLNETYAQINANIMYYKDGVNVDVGASRERQPLARAINSNRAKTFRPLVLTEASAEGGFMRGIHPMEYCHSSWPDLAEYGTDYWKMGYNTIVPRNGVDDPAPLQSTAW